MRGVYMLVYKTLQKQNIVSFMMVQHCAGCELSSDLQCSQEVAGLPQSGPGGIQLLQQSVLRVLHRGDLSLGGLDVVLPLLHPLLQPSHLQHVRQGYPRRRKQIHNLHIVPTQYYILSRGKKSLPSALYAKVKRNGHQKCI